ncbi:MFS transporter [Paenibacillus odorifer]|uniref:MDR family MFS transporter n=1 Tax=Paenibacillus TaxID=44249 RepID=UPI0003E23744|nr:MULTISPECIES: MDR family MFS transporter [Paenibacillus]ETT67727.1 EmrB/QacA subfamily drug resistance transporter [Paenibacillus sp. FSL H8-237]OMC98535.1 MFS transporter [Paenibacillus odorifer]OME51738.1 MFS transporter [Paenibacillus odorifer]
MKSTGDLERKLILIGVLLATFLAAIEGTVTGPAGPAIVGEFQGMQWLSWIFTSYLLAMAITTPIFGKISDLFGRKPVFMWGAAVFLLGSLLCGISQSMEQLILFRAIQGIGAGALIPMTFTIIGDIYSIEERAKTQGLLSSVWGISSLVGPLLGGYVVDYLSWRWVFVFNLPFGLLAMVFIARYLKEEKVRRKAQIDVAGVLLFAAGMGALLFSLSTGGQNLEWTSPLLIATLSVAVILLVLFFFVERRAPEPMLPLGLFSNRNIAVSTGANLLVSTLIIGLSTYVPLWVQGVSGKSAAISGLLLAPMSVGWMFGSIAGGRMILKAGSRRTAMLGLIMIAAGAIGLAFLTGESSQLLLLCLMLVCGVGFGYSSTVFTIIAQSSVAYEQRGASTALNAFTRSLGQTVGVAIFGSWLNLNIDKLLRKQPDSNISGDDINKLLGSHAGTNLSGEVSNSLRDALEGGLHSLFIVMAVFAVLSLIISWGLRKGVPSVEDATSSLKKA